MTLTISSWNAITTDNFKAGGVNVDLTNFNCWEEIKTFLEKKGFDLNGDDEELCITDTTFGAMFSAELEYLNVERVVNAIYKSGVMEEYYYERVAKAFCEALSFEEWIDLVEEKEDDWSEDISLWPKDKEDFGREYFSGVYYNLPDEVTEYIDYERYATDILYNGGFHETSEYIIEINC
jgi:hypothetical protein